MLFLKVVSPSSRDHWRYGQVHELEGQLSPGTAAQFSVDGPMRPCKASNGEGPRSEEPVGRPAGDGVLRLGLPASWSRRDKRFFLRRPLRSCSGERGTPCVSWGVSEDITAAPLLPRQSAWVCDKFLGQGPEGQASAPHSSGLQPRQALAGHCRERLFLLMGACAGLTPPFAPTCGVTDRRPGVFPPPSGTRALLPGSA